MITEPVVRYRQITCLTRTNLKKDDVVIPTDTRFDIPAGETITLADIRGPGRIVRFWVTLPVFAKGPVLRSAVLRLYWDNEQNPSVECPLGDFFGAGFAKPRRFVSDRLAIAGGGYSCLLEMPFNERAHITVENQGRKRLRLLVFHIGYHELDAPHDDLQTLHVQWRRQCPTERGRRPHSPILNVMQPLLGAGLAAGFVVTIILLLVYLAWF